MSHLTAERDDLHRRAIYAYAFYNVLPGHALRAEGKPYGWAEGHHGWVRVYGGPNGVALCECGETSNLLGSDAARKRWHAQHKDAIREPAPVVRDGALDGRVPGAKQ